MCGMTAALQRIVTARMREMCIRDRYSVKVQVPKRIWARTASEVENVWASVLYSDGSSVQKQVKWELDGLDFQSPGSFRIRGTVQNEQLSLIHI